MTFDRIMTDNDIIMNLLMCIKEYCYSQKDCKKCAFRDEFYNCRLDDIPHTWKIGKDNDD